MQTDKLTIFIVWKLWVNSALQSPRLLELYFYLLLAYLPASNIFPIVVDYYLQIYLLAHAITSSKWQLYACLALHMKVNLDILAIMSSICAFKPAQLMSASPSLCLFDSGLIVHFHNHCITGLKYIIVSIPMSLLMWFFAPYLSYNELHHGVQLHLKLLINTDCQCISIFTLSLPPNVNWYILPAYFNIHSIEISGCHFNCFQLHFRVIIVLGA